MAETTPPERPANSASKAEWIAYATAVGADTSGTRDEIIARIDTKEATAAEAQPETGAAPATPVEQAAPESVTSLAEPVAAEAQPAAVTFPATPVHTFEVVMSEDEPVRAGGHVLTDQGWVTEASLQTPVSDENGDVQ
ncbi:hypothetical protein ACFORH_43010 [Amycolatopsis roodepoortensis]|uniref:Cytoskeletal protein RodZ n=1 Tax=Amycolatopsis roodepoortensis TaxID=700274 RepID=A0ABR9L3W1_9PSEU|nr:MULTISPECIES: hypothetical protein [Amycolatopsis]MBE1575057.1 cytoskeletal protein RodZ [Amycolatopsis roodepoortensis]GHG97609.1 hypothetical protein GCM10017788_77250 [Amycolatopsis acidiphila]